ncbi:hypothetical protein BJ970_003000 [Saccharopolyspora phatthalungensis]|uniref:Uncharacterized protein n=2 Tax=Saccharopolyspora phatthalungensis TaxID=664693 RepID=A0A840Q4R3_9PSEU|nr:hypothetical protein [Saccharopolyspora phatthalungensis]
MKLAIVMLGYAVDDIERGLWSVAEREPLAAELDQLSAALRGKPEPGLVHIESERTDR